MSNNAIYRVPYGLLGLILVYSPLAILVERLAPACLHKPCNSEGVDNSVSGWVTDLWIGILMAGFALHLVFSSSKTSTSTETQHGQRSVHTSAIGAEASCSFAFLFGGLTHLAFPNSGAGDSLGMPGFYITWIIGFASLTAASIFQFSFCRDITRATSTQQYPALGQRYQSWGMTVLKGFVLLNILAFLIISVGCFWCLASPDMHTSRIINAFPEEDESPSCVSTITIGEGIWYISYAASWIPWGVLVYGAVVERESKSMEEGGRLAVWGLSVRSAAMGAPIVQWTIGFMYLIWVALVGLVLDRDLTDLYEDAHGPIVFHFGVLLTFFLMHNVGCAMTIEDEDIPIASRNV